MKFSRMNKELLYRFFEGTATLEEEQRVRQWVEKSEDNRALFMRERKIYDALLLVSPQSSLENKKEVGTSLWMVSTAVAVFLLLLVSGLYWMRIRDERNFAAQYHTLQVPAGQRMKLILADNTNVWLNANTVFRYPSTFSKKDRTVYLEGEAYFEVSKNKEKPFIVKTNGGDINVTGTSFNVKARSEHQLFETSLFEGSVEIYDNHRKMVSLKPNQQSVFKNGQLVVSQITDYDQFLWRKGLIAFNNKSLEDILGTLSTYFDVQIRIEAQSLPKNTYTGKFRQSDGIDYALRVLQKSIRFSYEKDDETGVIYIK
jgi:ferric-dicitrate binding protein FerR (iron transport regulator)